MNKHRIHYLRRPYHVVYDADGNRRMTRGEPVICIVSERNEETGTIRYGYSITMKGDHPSKKEGRRIAMERFVAEPLQFKCDLKEVAGNKAIFEIDRSIVQHFSQTIGKVNGMAKKMSRLWLRQSPGRTPTPNMGETSPEAKTTGS